MSGYIASNWPTFLWLWFLDRELDEGSFDPTVFTHNYDRLLSVEAAKLFFVEVYDLSRTEGWTSDQHFTADGTLIEAWASLKSFVRKDGQDGAKVASAKDEDLAIRRSTSTGSSGVMQRIEARPIRKAYCIGKPTDGQQTVFWDAGVDGKPAWTVRSHDGA